MKSYQPAKFEMFFFQKCKKSLISRGMVDYYYFHPYSMPEEKRQKQAMERRAALEAINATRYDWGTSFESTEETVPWYNSARFSPEME